MIRNSHVVILRRYRKRRLGFAKDLEIHSGEGLSRSLFPPRSGARARSRSASRKKESNVAFDQPTRPGLARYRSAERKRPRGKIEMPAGRFLAGRRGSLLVTGSDAGLEPGTRRSRRFSPSPSLSLYLSLNGIYRGDRSPRSILRYTFPHRVPQSPVPARAHTHTRAHICIHIYMHTHVHAYTQIHFSCRVCRCETRPRRAKGKETEAEMAKREGEGAKRRVRDGALHAHTDRDLRAVSGNRE